VIDARHQKHREGVACRLNTVCDVENEATERPNDIRATCDVYIVHEHGSPIIDAFQDQFRIVPGRAAVFEGRVEPPFTAEEWCRRDTV
jgi:hypothetical protein